MYKCLFENHFWIIISNSITFHCTALHCSSLLLRTALHLFISLSFFVSRFIYRLRSYIFGIFRRNLSQFSHFFRSSNSVIFLLFKCWWWWWMEVSSTKTVTRQFEVDLKYFKKLFVSTVTRYSISLVSRCDVMRCVHLCSRRFW